MRVVQRAVHAPAELGTEFVGVPEGADIELDLRLEAVMEGVLVSGSVHAPVLGECVRCLGEVSFDLDVELTELFAYPDRVVEDEDDEVRELQDELIDLEPALRDAVVLALPFQPVCREDCAGLCSECGVRLDDHPGHVHDVADPRWAALEGLLAESGPATQNAPSGPEAPDETKES
ncbi:YceD family protein [Spongisporangium articulatum]|uniref:YceD family protein n=1 Tax=Spongisporangium articulatum TaxID=3362603 RepID=A0ABW8AN20_9ACTN